MVETGTTRRRNELLDLLESAEAEWGERRELLITKEAEFLRKIQSSRVGSSSAANRIRESLADLTVDKVEEFLTGA